MKLNARALVVEIGVPLLMRLFREYYFYSRHLNVIHVGWYSKTVKVLEAFDCSEFIFLTCLVSLKNLSTKVKRLWMLRNKQGRKSLEKPPKILLWMSQKRKRRNQRIR